jgi:hypothetical protein
LEGDVEDKRERSHLNPPLLTSCSKKRTMKNNGGFIYKDKICSFDAKNCQTILEFYTKNYPHSTREEWIQKIRSGCIFRVKYHKGDKCVGTFCSIVLILVYVNQRE